MNGPRLIGLRFLPALLGALMLLSGCSSIQTEMGRPLPTTAPTFQEGQTTVEAVVRELGPPDKASRLSEGFTFLYEYSRMVEFQFGISADLPIIRFLKFIHAWNRLDQQVLLLTFDDHGVLQGMGGTIWSEDLGGGNAAQIIVTVISLSDVSRLRRPADAHKWGKQLLESPAVALNSSQSLRTGANGVQQRIIPDYVGQQTLEMAKPKTEREKRKIKKSYQRQD